MERRPRPPIEKTNVSLDANALSILLKVEDEIAQDNISSKTYSDAIRRLYEDRERSLRGQDELKTTECKP